MRETSRVSEAGRTTIPDAIREQYGIEPGDEVVWEETDAGIVVRKYNRQSARGMLVPEGTSVETRERVAEALEQRVVNRRRQSGGDDAADEHGEGW